MVHQRFFKFSYLLFDYGVCNVVLIKTFHMHINFLQRMNYCFTKNKLLSLILITINYIQVTTEHPKLFIHDKTNMDKIFTISYTIFFEVIKYQYHRDVVAIDVSSTQDLGLEFSILQTPNQLLNVVHDWSSAMI